MPHELTAVLAALAVEASPGDFAPAERLLSGSFSGLADVRRNHVAKIDAAELTRQEVSDQLSGLPIGQDAELHVVWIAERLGAQMNCATIAANVADLWFPATDDIACVLYSAGQLLVLVLDHEELITLSRLGASQAVRHPGEVLWMAGSSCCWPWFATGDPARCPQLDLLISARFRPREGGTVLDELIELERRGFVRRAPGGTGYRWAVTDAGSKGPGRRVRSAGPLLWVVNRRCSLILRNRLAFAAGMVFGSQNFVLISEAPLWCSRSRMARASLHAMGLPGPGTSGRHLHRLTTGGAF